MRFSRLKKRLTSRRFLLFTSGGLILFIAAVVLFSNIYIVRSTRKRIYSDINGVPNNSVGMVLGTSQYTRFGTTNLFFKYRMDAAAELYHKGKIKHIIVSGDNHVRSYDEATAMMKALIERGVPRQDITRDYAGFRTLDSVVRCKKVFGQHKVTIISQPFHVQRALFIADQYNMEAIGFAANDVSFKSSPKTRYREYLAKCKAVLDIFILRKQPKYLGTPVKINI